MVIEKMTCLLCRGLIAFKGRNQTRYLDHMKEEHNVRYDFDVLLVASLMDQAEKDSFVQENRNKFEPVKENSIVKKTSAELTTKKSKKRDETLQELVSNENTKTTVISSDEELEPSEVDNEALDADDEKTVEKPIIEGVLKCKTCAKYIKQSAMAEHKLSHDADKPFDEGINSNSENVMELEENVVKALTMVENASEVITNNNKSSKVTSGIKRKSKISKDDEDWEGGNGSDSDEDWDAKKTKTEKKKKIKCKVCSKKFASSMGVETHTRVVHRAKEPSAADMEKAITNALSKNNF